jgi:deazaflavin-dependent oxidoreductase (nitroreductase family)
MGEISLETAKKLQVGFRYFNRFMLLMWRLGLGPWLNAWPKVIGCILVITHIGRKSGLKRHTPANYAIVDGDIYCMAGFGRISDWYRNIKANPNVEVWLPDGWWRGTAKEVTEPEERLRLLRQVLIASGFAAFAVGINPYRITDQELKAITGEYCLLRIQRTAERTGQDGPGDLAWVWPLATMLLLPLVLCQRRRSHRACSCH